MLIGPYQFNLVRGLSDTASFDINLRPPEQWLLNSAMNGFLVGGLSSAETRDPIGQIHMWSPDQDLEN
jgi:hypothetical protein